MDSARPGVPPGVVTVWRGQIMAVTGSGRVHIRVPNLFGETPVKMGRPPFPVQEGDEVYVANVGPGKRVEYAVVQLVGKHGEHRPTAWTSTGAAAGWESVGGGVRWRESAGMLQVDVSVRCTVAGSTVVALLPPLVERTVHVPLVTPAGEVLPARLEQDGQLVLLTSPAIGTHLDSFVTAPSVRGQ